MTKFVEERVNELEKEVAELKLIVHELRKPSTVEETSASVAEDTIEFKGKQYKKVDRLAREGDVVVFYGSEHPQITNGKFYEIYRHKTEGFLYHKSDSGSDYSLDGDYVEGWHVYELIEQPSVIVKGPLMAHIHEVAEKPKTANELRGEIIEKAKEFIDYTASDDTHFEIEGNQVLAWRIIRKGTGYDALTGVAVCSPNDVFNEHIGCAIAVGRMEGLDVSEFEQAVQPTGIVVGMRTYHTHSHDYWDVTSDNIRYVNGPHKIINDTNAIYEV